MHVLLVAVIAAFAVTQLANFITTIYLHRSLSHRSLTLHPAVEAVCRVVLWITTGIRPRQWVAVHRKHHAYTDQEGDPHSPRLAGFAAVQFGNVVLYRQAARHPGLVDRYARDVRPDRWDRLFFDHALFGLGIGVAILVLVCGWEIALVASGLHAVLYLGLSGAINAVGHRYGKAPFPNTSRNNQWLAWLTCGEGLHSNHHAAPTSARFSMGPWQFDPGWWVVRGLRAARLASVRHDRPRLKTATAA